MNTQSMEVLLGFQGRRLVERVALMAILCYCCAPAAAQNSSLLHSPPPGSNPRPMTPGPMTQDPMTGGPMTPGPMTSAQWTPGQVPVPVSPPGSQDATEPVTPSGNPDRPPIMLDGVSWTYQPAPPIRVFRKNDVVTIRVDEITRMQAAGSAESRKRTLYEAVLSDWIKLSDFRLRPDPQENGDPTVGTESNSNYRAQSTVSSRESLAFNIAATVVDIRPNGSLVLEARKTIRVNDNLWETSLTGTCRAQDIAPDNVVLSKDLIDLEIRKDDQGHLRDGYKRGWFLRWFDRVQPF